MRRGIIRDMSWHVRACWLSALLCAWLWLSLVPSARGVGDINVASCPNEAFEGFREQLPDCRAYEQVTPAYKQGSRVEVNALSADGSHAIVRSFGDFGPGDARNNQNSDGAIYELSRGLSGWSPEGIDPSASQFPWDSYLDASPDLSKALFLARGASESIYDLDLVVREADGAIRDVGPMLPPLLTEGPSGFGVPELTAVTGIGGNTGGLQYAGASSDLSRVLFTVALKIGPLQRNVRWPGDTTATEGESQLPSLYEYTEGRSGPPSLVGVNDEGKLIGECGVTLGPAVSEQATYSRAVSADGSLVFFTVHGVDDLARNGFSSCSKSAPPVDELFARIDENRTLAISEPSPSECGSGAGTAEMQCRSAAPADAWFAGASRDGSKVFFTSTQQLSDDASEDITPGDSATATEGRGCSETTGVGGCNLYEYELNAGDPHEDKLVAVSGGSPDPQVQGVVSVSEDGSHVYFVAKGVLTGSETNEYGHAAQAGAHNLYVFQQDGAYPAGHLAFITTLSSETTTELDVREASACGTLSGSEKMECEERLQREFQEKNQLDEQDWQPAEASEAGIAATATPDGRFLVFPSVADLTPDDTSTVQQIFRYDAQSGELVRVSIGENGFNQDGNTSTLLAETPPDNHRFLAPTGLSVSEDGAFVVFRSADGLTPGALNGQPLENGAAGFAENVYEYHDGSVLLLSDGQDASAYQEDGSSVTLGTSGTSGEGIVGSGGDVFFQTADPLVARDGDTARDLYDARIDGGFPIEVPAGCAGEGCQGAHGAPSSTFGAPASMSLTGTGNLAPPSTVTVVPRKIARCTKPKKLSHGKCVKAKAKAKRTRAKRSHRRVT